MSLLEEVGLGLVVQLRDDTSEGVEKIGSSMEHAAGKITGLFSNLGKTVSTWGSDFAKVGNGAEGTLGKIGSAATTALGGMAKTAGSAVKGLAEVAEAAAPVAIPILAIGGAVAAASLGVAVETVKMAADFEDVTGVLVTGAGESREALGQIRQGLLEMGGEVGTVPDQLAKGMFMVESAGFHGATGLEVMKQSAIGAKIGMADQAVVADALTTMLKDYGDTSDQAAGRVGQLINTVAAGKMHMQDLAGALGTVLPYMAPLGIDFQQVGGAMATMTAHGVDAARAATSLRFGITSLMTPTKPAAAALRDLGLNVQELQSQIGSGDFVGAIGQISEKMKDMAEHGDGGANAMIGLTQATNKYNEAVKKHGQTSAEAAKAGMVMSQAQEAVNAQLNAATAGGANTSRAIGDVAKAFGGARGALLALTLMPNLDEFKNNIEGIGTVSEGAEKVAEDWTDKQGELNTQLDQMKASAQALGIGIGTNLMPYAKEFLTWVKDNKPTQEQMADIMEHKVVPAVEEIASAIKDDWPAIVSTGKDVVGIIKDIGETVGTAHDMFMSLPQPVRDMIDMFENAMFPARTLKDDIHELQKTGVTVASFFQNDFESDFNGVVSWFEGLPGQVGSAAESMGSSIVNGMESGLAGLGGMLQNLVGNAVRSININAGPFHLSAGGFHVDAPQMPSIHVPGFAGGGSYPGGWALVGERGPELINFGHAGTVVPNNQVREAASSNFREQRQLQRSLDKMISTQQRMASALEMNTESILDHSRKITFILERLAPAA